MMSPPVVSVVIPVRDSAEDLARCLASLREQSLPREAYEILVIDDGSREPVTPTGDVRVVRQEGLGAAAARNRGVTEAAGEYVAFVDADCIADPGWLEALIAPLREDPALAGTVGRYDSDQASLVARFVQLDLESRYRRMIREKRIDFLNTGNAAFRRELLVRYPFDTTYFRLEDIELSFRLSRDGHYLAFASGASVRHRHPERLVALMRRKFNYARYALPLYRAYPEKAVSDSATPQARRARVLFLGLALVALPFALLHPAALLASLVFALASLAFSFELIARALRLSPLLGIASAYFVLMGNLAFVAGTLRGLASSRPPGRSRG